MRVIQFIYLLFVFCMLALGGCGGGGSDNEPTTSAFSTELLDTNPTFYVQYPSDSGGTHQEIIRFTGASGNYTVDFSDNEFDAANNLIFTESGVFSLTLQDNGTLLVTLPGTTDTLTLLEQTATYIRVRGDNNGDPWVDTWHFGPPTGWITIPGDPTDVVFTTELLDASPIFYVQYPSDSGGTHQEIIEFSGSAGTYSINFADYEFDADNSLIFSESGIFSATLQDNGTLLVILPGDNDTLTLLEQTATYIRVRGDNNSDPWEDNWHFSPPAGWITIPGDPTDVVFTTELLDTSPIFYVQFASDGGGIHQEIIQFTGSAGSYSIDFSDYEFDADDNLIFSESDIFSATLQDNGTLLVILPGDNDTLTLLEQAATYIRVRGDNNGDPWEDTWHFSPPGGWLIVP